MNLDLIRSFFAIIEQGSLNRAAEKLRVSQSTLTRQMQTLEHELGGPLLERSSSGVALTATGQMLLEGMKPALQQIDGVLAEVRRRARGQSAELRLGYLVSAAPDYLHPALTQLRRQHPEVKVKLMDLSPGEQVDALRRGEIDLGVLGQAGSFLSKEFYVRRVATLPILVGLPESHRLAANPSVRLVDLRQEVFVGAPERDVPGHNRWITQLCRKAGFKARFVQDADSLSHGLSLIVTDNAVSLLPDFARKTTVPGVVFRPLRDANAKWELTAVWQRGRISAPVQALLEGLAQVNRT